MCSENVEHGDVTKVCPLKIRIWEKDKNYKDQSKSANRENNQWLFVFLEYNNLNICNITAYAYIFTKISKHIRFYDLFHSSNNNSEDYRIVQWIGT